MQWSDEGLVIGARRHGESSAIVEIMTRGHGRCRGLVRGAFSRTMRPVLQPGNLVAAVWRARLEEQLGAFVVEPLRARAARYLGHGFALHGISHLGALLRLLPERDPYPEIYDMADVLAEELDSLRMAPALMARFELALLAALGFGLDLDACALTGAREDLAYVSPKTGRAVSRAAGEPWRGRLLPYPAFLSAPPAVAPSGEEIVEGFRLTGHFLARDVLGPRGASMPAARAQYLAAATAGGAS